MERKNKNERVSDEEKELGGEVINKIEVGEVMNEKYIMKWKGVVNEVERGSTS